MQIEIPSLQSRCDHSATAFNLFPGLTEVVLFGGCPIFPKECRSDAYLPQIAETTVLRFGEFNVFYPYYSAIEESDYIAMQSYNYYIGRNNLPYIWFERSGVSFV